MKQLRQRQIRALLEQRPVRTQQDLVAALRERGIRATQATVSRDVSELGLVKVLRDGVPAYGLPSAYGDAEPSADERLRALLHELPIEVQEAGSLLVLRSLPGSAHAIASALDRARWGDVVGSIAGDDTVFVAVRDRRSMQRLHKRLLRLIE